jgi:hypothetical protein
MIIRILLLAALGLIGWRFFVRRNRLPVHIVVVTVVLGLAALAVVFPESTNDVAHLVGVGRGADLITYLVEVGMLFVIVHYYTKFVELDGHITKLVRELAIVRSELESIKRSKDPS